MRVMLDTSVLISIFVFPSEHFVRFRRSLAKHQIVLCSYVVDELKDVVARKFPERTKGVDAFLQSLPFSMSYTPEHFDTDDFPTIRDEADQPILVSAILEDVDILISRDKDFLDLEIEKPLMVNIAEFMELYPA